MIKELIESTHCTYEYENGSTHECYEFSRDELKQLFSLLAEECQGVIGSGMYDGHQQYAAAECRDVIRKHGEAI
jgi:hypothetical protein